MKTVRWGLLSTANINRRLIPAIRASVRGELTAVCSRNQQAADAYAAKWEIPQAFGSYEAMLASDAVDAVYIGLPNHLHAEWAIKAMQHGKHVLCEKPFALSLAEVDEMTVVSQQTGMVLAEAFMYRHHPQTKIVGEWVKNGRLGDIISMQSTFSFMLQDRSNVRLVPEWGGGCLWDVGIYPVSLAQFVMGGPPVSVFGSQWLGETGIDESFSGQLQYGAGKIAQIGSAFRAPFHTWAEIIGTAGRLVIKRPFNGIGSDGLLFHHPDDTIEEIPVPEKELYLGEVEDMHEAVLDGRSPYLALSETRDHIKTILALYQSAHTGKPIELDTDFTDKHR